MSGSPRSVATLQGTATTVLATVGVLLFLVVWPIAVVNRVRDVQDASFGYVLEPIDPLLTIGGLLWIGVVISSIAVRRPARRLRTSASTVTAGFANAVSATYFGVGDRRGWTFDPPHALLSDLTEPDEDLDLAPPVDTSVEPSALDTPETLVDRTIETVDYVVQHRDSWWSIAETQLGDADQWSIVRDLNVGSEVESGVILAEDTVLRSGWNLRVPLPSDTTDQA